MFSPAITKNHSVIALYGGSFNPPHLGHLHIMTSAQEAFEFDELWMMVSPGNPFKDPKTYAPLSDRLNMSHITTRHHHDWLKPTDFEKHLDTNQTADVLDHLVQKFPNNNFVWIMGADNLIDFHKWDGWKHIMNTVPILVMPRPGENEKALSSRVAFQAASMRLAKASDVKTSKKGWYFHEDGKHFGAAASNILKELRAGKRNIEALDPLVETYLLEKDLYNIPQPQRRHKLGARNLIL